MYRKSIFDFYNFIINKEVLFYLQGGEKYADTKRGDVLLQLACKMPVMRRDI